jgi:hypothetical protein
MIKRLALQFGFLFLLNSAVSAQALPTGTWTGSVTPPGDAPLALTFDVSAGDTISILIHFDQGDFPASDAKLAGDTLTFRFQPGPIVRCNLVRKGDGSFSGECSDEDGISAILLMVPPAKLEGSGQ